ncbi:hypothetical protein ACP3V5_11545 [Vibrio maritimus]|uniref:Uncharacterized protein n=1 Tax=Vibrio chaetopteri TaxID=3016528 RepID=A0AAU8BLT3_9VIBR
MPFIYAIAVNTDTKDDVNKKLRVNGLEGEVVVDNGGNVYICPQISTTKWMYYPKSEQRNHRKDTRWDSILETTLLFMEKHYIISVDDRHPTWLDIDSLFRCPKMELYIESLDLISSRHSYHN